MNLGSGGSYGWISICQPKIPDRDAQSATLRTNFSTRRTRDVTLPRGPYAPNWRCDPTAELDQHRVANWGCDPNRVALSGATEDGLPVTIAIPIGLMGGEGGEGECREGGDVEGQPDANMIAEGGGGGGGYGGGGGLYEDSAAGSDTSSAGGGGGGSYAAASTITRVAPPYTVPSSNTGDGWVMIIFP